VISRYSRLLELAGSLVMAAAVILLPVTSLPVLSRAMADSLVAPPSAILVALMALFWLPVFIYRGGLIPRESAAVWAFFYIALISAGIAFFRIYPSFKGYTVSGTETSAVVTLAMAAAFYLIFSLYYRRSHGLRTFFVMLNISGILLLGWSLVQLYVVVTTQGEYSGWMVRIQDLLSIRPLTAHIFYNRVTGLAYEPSWLGNMLNLLYLPFWLAASVAGFSAFRKLGPISLENVLLPLGALVLLFTFSRIGLAAFFLTLVYLTFVLVVRLAGWLARRIARGLNLQERAALRVLLTGIITLIIFGLLFYVALQLLHILAQVDSRVARLFDLDNYYTRDPYRLAQNLAFGERLVYWAVGWRIFAENPLLGVGPGNAGYFFVQKLPLAGWELAETIQVIDVHGYLPNVKSLWSRLLAETGLLGFSTFAAWLFVLWHAGRYLKTHREGIFRMAGWMGSFVVIAFILEGFSTDSFALPYLWVSLGMVTAASALARQAETGASGVKTEDVDL
jgi:O-antigen ligase